jgi:hypothetical protein
MIKVAPVRFTDDVPGMRRFCEALGLAGDVESDNGVWVALAAPQGGLVGLHEAAGADQTVRAGTTELSFETDEPLEVLRDRLAAAGFPAVIIDESFGRSLRVEDPDGTQVQVNEAMTDFHGYRASTADAAVTDDRAGARPI